MKKRLIQLFLISFSFIIILTGCSNNIEKYIKMLDEYLKDVELLHNKPYPATLDNKHHKFNYTDASGNISNVLCNLDDDKDYEGLIFDFDSESIDVELLDFQDEKIKLLDSETILNFLPEIDSFNITLFAIKLNNKPYFFLEINGNSSIFADGYYYEMKYFSIDKNKIVESASYNYQASVVNDDDAKDYLSKIKRMGLNAKTINKSIFSQNKNAVMIFEVTRTHLKDFKIESVGKRDDNYQYGTTTFKDNLYKKYIIDLKNVKTIIDTDNMEYEFKPSSLGRYKFDNFDNESYIMFELTKEGDKYNYIMLYYPANSIHASEELWGTWDVTKTDFKLKNENKNNLADYKIKNVKYLDRGISFTIEQVKLKSKQYKDYTIPSRNYSFMKE